jgi:putative ABC transport system ATP-binding protein
MVELEGVVRRYREGETEHVVLDGASARIAEGEFVALLGPSGSGKSTVLNLMGGIDRPDSGHVRVAGLDLGTLDERQRTLFRRKSIGFVFQFFNLIPTLTVEENLRLPLELNGRADDGIVMRLLERVELASRAHSFPDRLSGGEQQRVAIARALVHDPALLLADEPTGNLDEDTGELVLDVLEDLVRSRRGTLVVVTHSERLAARADRVLRLTHGKLVEGARPRPFRATQSGAQADRAL